MAVPFAAATWRKVSDQPLPVLAGANFVNVIGLERASYHAPSGTLQVFARPALSFTKFWNMAAISFDAGRTWATSYDGRPVDQGGPHVIPSQNGLTTQEHAFGGWSIDTESGLYSFQIRINAQHAFFAGSGELKAGGVSIYGAGPNSSSFSHVQTLYSWPHTLDGTTQAFFNFAPTIAPPIQIAGSGPDGEDAYWMVVSFGISHGVASNINHQDLWRSLDGISWENVGDLSSSVDFRNYGHLALSTTGRIILVGAGVAYTDDVPDLVGASWSIGSDPGSFVFGGHAIPMYGGTWVGTRNGGLSTIGNVLLSCDDAGSFFTNLDAPTVPADSVAHVMKLGPSEMLLITRGFTSPTTETIAYYSADGGESFVSGGVWLASSIGESVVSSFIKSDGHPLVVTQHSVFTSSDKAQGVAGTRTQCPLANAGLAAARPLLICGAALSQNSCEAH